MLILFLCITLSIASLPRCRVEKPSIPELEILIADLFCQNQTVPTLRDAMNLMSRYYRHRMFRNCATLSIDKEVISARPTHYPYGARYSNNLGLLLITHACTKFVDTSEGFSFEYDTPETHDERIVEVLNRMVIWLASEDACDTKSKTVVMDYCEKTQTNETKNGLRTVYRGYLLIAACKFKEHLSRQ